MRNESVEHENIAHSNRNRSTLTDGKIFRCNKEPPVWLTLVWQRALPHSRHDFKRTRFVIDVD